MSTTTVTQTHSLPNRILATSTTSPEHPEKSPQKEITLTKPYRPRSDVKSFTAIAVNYGVAALCIASAEWSTRSSYVSTPVAAILYAFAAAIIASRLRAMENLVHEASHNNLFESPSSHGRWQFLYAFPVFKVVSDYRSSHMIHHKHLGDRQKDPDIQRLFDLGLDRLPERPGWFLYGLPATGFCTYEYLMTSFWEFWESPSSRISKAVYWAGVLGGLAYGNLLQHFAYYFLVPFFVILPVTRWWAEISEHLGLDLRGHFGSSRTNIGFVHRWYLNPHNDGYHAVHHLNAQVPFHRLPEVHEQLMRNSKPFAEKTVFSHGVLETFSQMARNQTKTY